MLTVWGRTNSINVQKVLWCCEELGLPYKRIDAGGEFGVTETTAYLSINPTGLVPTIDDNGFCLWESNVIVRYLAQKHDSGGLYPADISRRFDAERWMDWQATSLWPPLRIVFIGLIRTPQAERNAQVIAQAEARCTSHMALLDRTLVDREFLIGDSFSMADIPAGAAVHRWYALDIVHPDLPHLTRWYDTLRSKESFRQTIMLPLS
jgi:glutathione S-transferase